MRNLRENELTKTARMDRETDNTLRRTPRLDETISRDETPNGKTRRTDERDADTMRRGANEKDKRRLIALTRDAHPDTYDKTAKTPYHDKR